MIHADVWQKPAPYCKVTILQLKKKMCLWESESCGQQGLASSVKHLQGLVTPSSVRTPRDLLDGRAEEEADPEARLAKRRPRPGCPQLEGASQKHTGTVMGKTAGFQEEAVPLTAGTLM